MIWLLLVSFISWNEVLVLIIAAFMWVMKLVMVLLFWNVPNMGLISLVFWVNSVVNWV